MTLEDFNDWDNWTIPQDASSTGIPVKDVCGELGCPVDKMKSSGSHGHAPASLWGPNGGLDLDDTGAGSQGTHSYLKPGAPRQTPVISLTDSFFTGKDAGPEYQGL